MKRQTNDTAPSAMRARRIWLNGVRSLPESVSNSGWWSWASAAGVAFSLAATAATRLRSTEYAVPRNAPTAMTAGGTECRAAFENRG